MLYSEFVKIGSIYNGFIITFSCELYIDENDCSISEFLNSRSVHALCVTAWSMLYIKVTGEFLVNLLYAVEWIVFSVLLILLVLETSIV